MGLSGLGDLVLTCTGDLSRNRRLGLALGRGVSAERGDRRDRPGGRKRGHRRRGRAAWPSSTAWTCPSPSACAPSCMASHARGRPARPDVARAEARVSQRAVPAALNRPPDRSICAWRRRPRTQPPRPASLEVLTRERNGCSDRPANVGTASRPRKDKATDTPSPVPEPWQRLLAGHAAAHTRGNAQRRSHPGLLPGNGPGRRACPSRAWRSRPCCSASASKGRLYHAVPLDPRRLAQTRLPPVEQRLATSLLGLPHSQRKGRNYAHLHGAVGDALLTEILDTSPCFLGGVAGLRLTRGKPHKPAMGSGRSTDDGAAAPAAAAAAWPTPAARRHAVVPGPRTRHAGPARTASRTKRTWSMHRRWRPRMPPPSPPRWPDRRWPAACRPRRCWASRARPTWPRSRC